ncbi:hypothetical protein GKQ23_15765 [Erwinia sp. E602]|uniref:hypothetical protein n=1 Tax=Erwinia sp. E602 TaxID=2675378 RepID=UPI001BA92CDE|nr:hypothetical protein [Erwinia sp. E602]QUG76369.1 hypothetical protein GKQ23_15765 [Erwinia sp. E602]
MELIDRIWSWMTYLWLTMLAGVGMMTQQDWLAAIGAVIGVAAFVMGEMHRRRMSRIHETTNAMLNQLITAVREDTDNRQEVKELISTIRGAAR